MTFLIDIKRCPTCGNIMWESPDGEELGCGLCQVTLDTADYYLIMAEKDHQVCWDEKDKPFIADRQPYGGTVTLNASQILLNEPSELWPIWWDRKKCVELIHEMERAGFGPSYYTKFQAQPSGGELSTAELLQNDDVPF